MKCVTVLMKLMFYLMSTSGPINVPEAMGAVSSRWGLTIDLTECSELRSQVGLTIIILYL